MSRQAGCVSEACAGCVGRLPALAISLVSLQLEDRWTVAADRALGITRQLQLPEAHAERVIDDEPADQRLADAEKQLDRFGRLDRADDPGQDAEDACFGAARHEARRRRFRVQAPIARSVLRREH